MTTLVVSKPIIGQPNATEDPKTLSGLTAIETWGNGQIDGSNMLSVTRDQLGLSDGSIIRRGKSIIATSENTSATSYAIGNLTTPDRVQTLALPTDGLIVVAYQAIWQNTVASNGRAAIFIGPTQLKAADATGAPVVQQATGPIETNDDGLLFTSIASAGGLLGVSGVGAATEVTTGQTVGSFNNGGGALYIFAAAGTYDVSVQFKNNAAGTLTVKNRHLWVWTIGF